MFDRIRLWSHLVLDFCLLEALSLVLVLTKGRLNNINSLWVGSPFFLFFLSGTLLQIGVLKCHLLIRSNLTTMKIFNLSTVFPISLTVLSFSPNIYRLLVLKKNYLIGLLFMVCLYILQWILYKGRDFWELSSVMFPPLIVLCLAHGSHSIRICYMKPETDSQT